MPRVVKPSPGKAFEPPVDEGPEVALEKASYAVKTFRKIVVDAITDTTRAKERHMRFMTGLNWRAAKIICAKLAPNAAQK